MVVVRVVVVVVRVVAVVVAVVAAAVVAVAAVMVAPTAKRTSLDIELLRALHKVLPIIIDIVRKVEGGHVVVGLHLVPLLLEQATLVRALRLLVQDDLFIRRRREAEHMRSPHPRVDAAHTWVRTASRQRWVAQCHKVASGAIE